jgi:very-short-patch-repair endonuclease
MEGFKILTDETFLDEDFDLSNNIVDNVYWYFIGVSRDNELSLMDSLTYCESPIEQLMSMELTRTVLEAHIPELVEVIEIERQKTITIGEKTYRVDFAIPVKYWDSEKTYIIERDGHEFHQKTKVQVERDNSRMRDLQSAGYTVIRFSGSEIYHKPGKCAWEVRNIIQAPAIKFIERMLENGT